MPAKKARSPKSQKSKSKKTNKQTVEKTKSGTSVQEIPSESEPTGGTDTEGDVVQSNATVAFADPLVQRKSSIFNIIRSGNVSELQKFVEKEDADTVTFVVNSVSEKDNRDPLSIAVISGDTEMIKEILKIPQVQTRLGLLHAVQANNMEVVELILDYHNGDSRKASESVVKESQKRRSLTSIDVTASLDFDDHITPLLLAAKEGHYELIELFLDKGDRLELPHAPTCGCESCRLSATNLHRAYERLDMLKALSNQNYLALMTGADEDKDPIEECFTLRSRINEFAAQESEFDTEYKALNESLEAFAVDLLALCRSDEEVQLFLSKIRKKEHAHSQLTGTTDFEKKYPRLVYAMSVNFKTFSAHPHSQEMLFQTWKIDKFMGLDYSNPIQKIFLIAILMILFPLWCFYSMLDPHFVQTAIGKPQCRFWYSSASHLFFLFCLASLHSTLLPSADRGDTHLAMKILIGFYVANYTILLVAHLIQAHFDNVPFTGWDYFEIAHIIMFCITFVFWGMAATRENDEVLTRDTWDWDDPVLLGECFMSIATTMAFLKITKLFILHNRLGPLQTSLGKMISDASTFALFFITVNVAYSIGLVYMYKPYTGLKWTDDNGEEREQAEDLLSIRAAMFHFFWAVFAVASHEVVRVGKMPEICHNETNPACTQSVYNHHDFTESFSRAIWGVYFLLTMTILMNMLIAVMGKTYEKISDNMDVEWKFARSQVWVSFMKEKLSPPPFTIFSVVFALLGGMMQSGKHSKKAIEAAKIGRKHDYRLLIKHLMQRYFRKVFKDASEDKPTKDDIINAKDNIRDLKNRMRAYKKEE